MMQQTIPPGTTTLSAEWRAADQTIAGSSNVVADDCCFHCGTPVNHAPVAGFDKVFCCRGCLTVFELLKGNGLANFYELSEFAGVRPGVKLAGGEFDYLEDPLVRAGLVDFADDRITRVTFHVPAIHCLACVWLLENLFRLQPGIGRSEVNFPRREVAITFENARTTLAAVVELLGTLGYPPDLKLADLEKPAVDPARRRLWLQLGIAGFAFGNSMLLGIATYLGLDGFSGPGLRKLFGFISLALAMPVLTYSASGYWQAAWVAVRRRILTIEVPIALGIAALAAWSTVSVLTGQGAGYFDSLAGLLFLLLAGKLFQQKTFDRLAFDLDYRSFFPLAITRKQSDRECRVSLSQLHVGDRLVIRNGELIPADARLIVGPAVIDYSFVTGESLPVEKQPSDHLYAGGRQTGGAIEIETLKPVSQGYLTSLWNQPAFRKSKHDSADSMINRYSRRFTKSVITIAIATAVNWLFQDPPRALVAFTSVLIVACPCALALAVPFTLGTAQRVLARSKVFVRNPSVIETLARVNTVVLDKTGTLTQPGAGTATFDGEPLSPAEAGWILSVTPHSMHPYATRAGVALAAARPAPSRPVAAFSETPGGGMEGTVDGHRVCLGSRAWLASHGIVGKPNPNPDGSEVHVAIDNQYRGRFVLGGPLRARAARLISQLSDTCELALLSGDNERERAQFRELFGPNANLCFNQSPAGKLEFIRERQTPGKTVMMVGDGLNDAGALQQSDVGVAVVEDAGAFSPASDVILAANMVTRLPEILRFSQKSLRVARLGIILSGIYNLVGISLAARGQLSPVICAVLMPVSSITVVVVTCGLTGLLGRRAGFDGEDAP